MKPSAITGPPLAIDTVAYSLKAEDWKCSSRGVECARWAMAASVSSPPHVSSMVMMIPSSAQTSRTTLVLVRPPKRLIFRLTASMARS